MDLGDMLDRIQGFEDVMKAHNYAWAGRDGKTPWSHQWDHTNGTAIDVRGSDWTFYSRIGEVLKVGDSPAELEAYLKGL